MSSSHIEKGARWSTDLASRLEVSDFGIICLTLESLHSDWLLFEAGALAKKLTVSRVCPLLIDLKHSEVSPPLSQFQLTLAN